MRADLPYEDESFDLITHLNMPPFIAEVERVLRPGGQVVVASSWGSATPFYTPKAVARLGVRKAGDRDRRGRRGRGRAPTGWAASPAHEHRDRHLVLVNPSAGGGRTRDLLPELEGALRRHGLKYRLVMTTSLDHGVREARAAAADGEIPVVMSGDGLIGQVGGSLVGSEAPLGVIPGGRGNDFARVVGIPTAIPATPSS